MSVDIVKFRCPKCGRGSLVRWCRWCAEDGGRRTSREEVRKRAKEIVLGVLRQVNRDTEPATPMMTAATVVDRLEKEDLLAFLESAGEKYERHNKLFSCRCETCRTYEDRAVRACAMEGR